jgi:hypothetical protein
VTSTPEDSLRVTETNAAGDESEGTIWNVRYGLFGVAICGVTGGGFLFGALYQSGSDLVWSALAGGMPVMLVLTWVVFKQTHPPAHDTDLLALWIRGPGFGPKTIDPDLE